MWFSVEEEVIWVRGIDAKVKWKETVKKKEALLVKSRNPVASTWTLVALCCGTHATHILYSLGIHIHGKLVKDAQFISELICMLASSEQQRFELLI